MSGGKARGGGESWHGRGAVPGTGTVPFLLHLLQQAGGCTGMLWDPALVSSKGPEPDCSGHSPGCSGDPTPVPSRTLPSLQTPPHPLHQHPSATSSYSPSAPQVGQAGPAPCPWHGRAARAPGCRPSRAGREQEDAMIRRMPGRDQECCAGRSCLGDGASNVCSAPRAPRWGREAPVGR